MLKKSQEQKIMKNKLQSLFFRNRIFIYIMILGCNYSTFGQVDTLSTKREILKTHVYFKESKLSKIEYLNLIRNNKPSVKYDLYSKIMFPSSGVVTLAGIYLGYDAIKGIPKTAIIDGKPIDYTIRSLPKLLIGIATVVGGISLLEFSNDYKVKSVKSLNNIIVKEGKKTSFQAKFGITPSQNIGIYAKL